MGLEIEVVSDAGGTLFGERIPLLRAAPLLAAHDLEMVKPALLYADSVTLYSANFFVESQIDGYLTRLAMPLQAVVLLARLAAREREELAKVGITDADLPSAEDAESALKDLRAARAKTEQDASFNFIGEFVLPLAERWESHFSRVFPPLAAAFDKDRNELFASDLDNALDAGLLTIAPHTIEPPNPSMSPSDILFGESARDYQERAVAEALLRVASSSGVVLLDPWGTSLAEHFGLADRSRRAVAAELGVQLLAPLPTVQSASVAEILNLREELKGPLVRFRAAMTEAASSAPQSSADRREFTRALHDEKVAPALLEIYEETRANSFVGRLVDVVRDPRSLAVPAGGLFLSGGLTGSSLLAAAAAVTGMTVPVLQAALDRQRQGRTIASNPFYLLHRLRS